ncbi:MAG: CTP synthase [Candidatus Goldbacteria bacterium]|nr:CTP synthase [Candidatus Goldiibacteriota bacterium]
MTKEKKYIFVTGGVVSSLGKGIAASSIGALLEGSGLNITIQKLDPYINVDPGTMNPFQHGEVYVTDDGAETDLDIGHYERFTSANYTAMNNVTTGKIYGSVIEKERKGEFLGKTVQVIPHITDEIKSRIKLLSKQKNVDVIMVEIGGTVGDIESLPFLEAIRQFALDVGKNNVLYVHLTLIPFIKVAGELKTKPTQHSVSTLRSIGIQPDILICRTEKELTDTEREKIALFCNVEKDAVIQGLDVPSIYKVPLMYASQGINEIIVEKLHLKGKIKKINVKKWQDIIYKIKHPIDEVKISVVGKYVNVLDAYKSIKEAIGHGGLENRLKVDINWVDSENFDCYESAQKNLKDTDGILVPGGFGMRGIEGKIMAVRYAREKKIPFFGICLGMQAAIIEIGRNVLGLKGCNSTEFDRDTKYPVIALMEEQKNTKNMGGTMRLGAYPCTLKKGTKAFNAYKEKVIFERHRHRYEFNNVYRDKYEKSGVVFTGLSPNGILVEIIELKNHPWFVATQFHPEFKSKPDRAHPLFSDFVAAAYKKKMKNIKT